MNILNSQQSLLREKYVFLLLFFIGIISTFVLYPAAVGYPYQYGHQMVGLFIPPFCTGLYLYYFFYLKKVSSTVLLKAIVLFFAQLIPFFPLFFQETNPYPGEDLARNMFYARNMISNHTLWGGDELVFGMQSKSFITQPGYRYFVALELLLFKKLYRFVSIFNLLLFIFGVYIYFKTVDVSINSTKVKRLLGFISLLAIPYATKNVLMGLSEWFVVVLLIFTVWLYRVKNNSITSMFFLGLIPFVRQNLLLSVLLLAVWIILMNKKRVGLLLAFIIPLMLPLYHNLYYAGEWRFFISIFQWPFLTYPQRGLPAEGINYWLILNNALHYFGFHIKSFGNVDFLEESIGFLLPFSFLYVYIQKKYLSGIKRLFFLAITFSTIIPSIFLATDFYPRFEFVNVYITLISFVILYTGKCNLDKRHLFSIN